MSEYYLQNDNFSRSRLKSSYASVIVSISLLLFMMGILFFSVINGKMLIDYIKETFTFTLILKEEATDLDIMFLEKELKLMPEMNKVQYIKKEDALEKLKSELGIDFMQFLNSNPLFNSYDVSLRSEFVNKEKIVELEDIFRKKTIISEVIYDNVFLSSIEENIKKIQLWVFNISIIFFVICIILIYNAIKLSLYSKRFTIKTMQLVGASQAFISRPFILKNISFGILSYIITIIGLIFIYIFISNKFPLIFIIKERDYIYFSILFIGLFLFSVLLTSATTYLSIRKFLRKKVEELYS